MLRPPKDQSGPFSSSSGRVGLKGRRPPDPSASRGTRQTGRSLKPWGMTST